MSEAQNTKSAIEQSEAIGGLVLPAVFAIVCGIYKLVTLPWPAPNGEIILGLGLLAAIGSAAGSRKPALVRLAAPLGLYTFGVIGCASLLLALMERSGIWVISVAMFWMVFGVYVLSRMERARSFLKS